jgi:hypothetical protein
MIAREVMEFKAERLAAERNASMGRTVVSLPVPTRDQIPPMERDDRDEGERFYAICLADIFLMLLSNCLQQTPKQWTWMKSSQTGELEGDDYCIGLKTANWTKSTTRSVCECL